MTAQNKLSRFSRNLLITACLVVSAALVFALYVQSREGIAHANELRYLSFELADELRQSSDDLTRMVRTYVVTGDPVYKKYYQDILDIRNGNKPRPDDYQHIYWDIVTANAKPPHPGSRPAIALLELMRQAGFTGQELGKLAEAKANSDGLTAAEFEAMKLVESGGLYADAKRTKARMMLHDDKYHQAKAAIMKLIDEFFDLLDQRTLNAVEAAKNRAEILRYLFVALGLAVMFMLWRTYVALRDTLGGSVDEVYAQIAKIGSGDFSSAISGTKVKDGLENSVLGWLSETQLKLSDIDRERKRKEGEYSTLIQTSFDGFCIADLSGRILDVNEAYCQMLGYTREEFLRLQVLDFEASESPEETAAHFQKFIHTGSDRFQTRQRRKDGTVIDVEASAQYVAELGERIFSFIRDITERKRAEDKLRESNERYDLVVKGTSDGIWDWNIRTNTNYFSPRFLELLGYEPDEKENKLATFEKFLHPEDRAWVFDRVRQHLEDNVPYNVEYRMRTKNGEYKWFLARGQAVRNQSGKPVRMAGSATDITERKQAEAEIHQLNAELEQRVAARTAQLQTANADLESFSYSVSHDLRAPLRAIDSFAAILREDYAPRLDEEGLRLFKVVSDNAQKMGQLIDDILAFSRAGRSELQLITLDMDALVQQVWQELEPQRAGRIIEFRLTPLPSARGDPAAVRQVLENLLDNAVKFTHGREAAVIEVTGHREGEENIYSIRDNGAGFDMDYVNKLFGLFQRLHGMEEFEGTGVGLSIVKRFIMKHGGQVWAEGKTGEGATFWFTLPAEMIAE